jgi:4'-phosphopantetheinyl transferase
MTASLWLLAGDASTLSTSLDLERSLDDGERQHAASFGNAERRAQYTVGRGVLRQLLSSMLNVPSTEIELVVEPTGRPRLHPKHQSTLSFSISHTRNLVCWALHPQSAIGVDTEPLQRPRDVGSLAARFFHTCERDYVDAARSEQDAQRRFLQCWTLKEAWFKAFAGSKSLLLSELGFDFDDATKQVTPVHAGPTAQLHLWSSVLTQQGLGEHVLALAWQGRNDEVRCWRLNSSTLIPESLRLKPAFQFPAE